MKKYFCKLSVLALLISANGNTVGTVSAQSAPESVTFNNEITFDELDRYHTLASLDKPFGEIVEELKEQTGLQIRIHESAIDNNLDRDSPINFHLESTRLATILDVLLETWQCTYTIRDGIVIIVSEDYAIENPMREVLDCSELLQTIKPLTVKRRLSSSGRSGGGGGGGGGGVFQVVDGNGEAPQQPAGSGGSATDDTASPRRATVEQYETFVVTPAEQLIELIVETVDPDGWEVNGGTARMRELNGKLIIVQTVNNHRDIKELLESLK